MKNLIITTALVLGVAAPAVAQTQLERQLGVEAGAFTASELVQLKHAATQDAGNERSVFFSDTRTSFSASNITNANAASIFAQIAAESKEDE